MRCGRERGGIAAGGSLLAWAAPALFVPLSRIIRGFFGLVFCIRIPTAHIGGRNGTAGVRLLLFADVPGIAPLLGFPLIGRVWIGGRILPFRAVAVAVHLAHWSCLSVCCRIWCGWIRIRIRFPRAGSAAAGLRVPCSVLPAAGLRFRR